MLLEKPNEQGEVLTFKIVSGEEIVARLDSESETEYVLLKPMMIVIQPDSVGLGPFMFSMDPQGKFHLMKNSVVCSGKTEAEIAKQYISTTTGVALQQEAIMTLHEEIVQAYNNYLKEAETFEDKNVKAAAARARKALGDLGKLTKDRRKEIQDRKNEM